MAYELSVETTPPVAKPIGSASRITDFLANVKVHAGGSIDVHLLEEAITPEREIPPESLPRLLEVSEQVRHELRGVALEKLVRLKIDVPEDRIEEIASVLSGPDRSVEAARKLGVTWTEVPFEECEIQEIRDELKMAGGANRHQERLSILDVYEDILDAIKFVGNRGIQVGLALRCQ